MKIGLHLPKLSHEIKMAYFLRHGVYTENIQLSAYFNCAYDQVQQFNLLSRRAKPKSHSLTIPLLVIKIFSGFTSLWMHWNNVHITFMYF